jgi:hypothetical protein
MFASVIFVPKVMPDKSQEKVPRAQGFFPLFEQMLLGCGDHRLK